MKIGFIDYYLDEWHANNYPQMIKDLSGGKYEVAYAYGMIDSPLGGMTNREWAEKNRITLLSDIEEVIAKSDCLIVLSPDNPEMHEELCRLPLQSGKLVYVDKTFAPDRACAERIFAHAKAHQTECYSSSALRFASELSGVEKEGIEKIYSEGPGTYAMYSIHQIEPIVCLMNCRAKRVMFLGTPDHPSMLIEFADGRLAQMYQTPNSPFRLTLEEKGGKSDVVEINSDYFRLFLKALIAFFETGKIPVPHSQTVDVIAIREAGLKAMQTPYAWVNV